MTVAEARAEGATIEDEGDVYKATFPDKRVVYIAKTPMDMAKEDMSKLMDKHFSPKGMADAMVNEGTVKQISDHKKMIDDLAGE